MELYKLIIYKGFSDDLENNDNINPSLGHFDFVEIKECVDIKSINELFKLNNVKKLDNNLIEQTFVLYSSVEEKGFIKENQKKYLYEFIIVSHYKKYYNFTVENLKENIENDVIYETYNTINNVENVTLLYANDYKRAMNYIFSFMKNGQEYNYTIMALNKAVLKKCISYNCDKYVTEKSISNSIIKQELERKYDFQIHIGITKLEQTQKKFDEIKKMLSEKKFKYKFQPILGNNDAQLFLYNITLKEYFMIFTSCIKGKKNEITTSTYILFNDGCFDFNINNCHDNFSNSNCIDMEKKYTDLENEYHNLAINDKEKKIKNIIDLMKKNISNPFFLSIYPSLKSIVKRCEKIDSNNFDNVDLNQYINEVYDITMVLSNTALHTFHDPFVSLSKYLISDKLLVFYTAFLHLIMHTVKESDIERNYIGQTTVNFLIKPTTDYIVQFKMLEDNIPVSNRLVIIDLPIENVFNLNNVVFQLVHEMGHFVGNNIRRRKDRVDAIKEFTIEYIIRSIINNKVVDKINLKKIYNYIDSFVFPFFYELKLTETDENCYLYYIEKKLEIIEDHIHDNLFIIKSKLSEFIEDDENLLMNLISLFESSSKSSLGTSLSDGYKYIEYLFRECFADILAINILKCNCIEYISFFINGKQFEKRDSLETLDEYRIAFVSSVCFINYDSIGFGLDNIKAIKKSLVKEEYSCLDVLNDCIGDASFKALRDYLIQCDFLIKKMITDEFKDFSNIFRYFNDPNVNLDKVIKEMKNIVLKYYNLNNE